MFGLWPGTLACLRTCFWREGAEPVCARKDEGNGWGIVEHEFTLQAHNYVELIYEFVAADGFGALDKSSLRLIRLTPACAENDCSLLQWSAAFRLRRSWSARRVWKA